MEPTWDDFAYLSAIKWKHGKDSNIIKNIRLLDGSRVEIGLCGEGRRLVAVPVEFTEKVYDLIQELTNEV
jgi:hypothetical protein